MRGEQPIVPLTRMGICSRCGAGLVFSAMQWPPTTSYINCSATRCPLISSCRFDSSRQAAIFVFVADSTKNNIIVVTALRGPLGTTELGHLLLTSSPSSSLTTTSAIKTAHQRSDKMPSNLSVQLTAPNGRKYTQPTGLFINNEWVPSSDGKKITSINPT